MNVQAIKSFCINNKLRDSFDITKTENIYLVTGIALAAFSILSLALQQHLLSIASGSAALGCFYRANLIKQEKSKNQTITRFTNKITETNKPATPLQINNNSTTATQITHEILTKIPCDVKTSQQKLMKGWMDKWKSDFLAHAIWSGNFSKVIKDKALLPAEMVLRKYGTVEYEAGVLYGQRGTVTLPELTEEELQSLEVLETRDQEALEKCTKLNETDPFTANDKMMLNDFKRKIALKQEEHGVTISLETDITEFYDSGAKYLSAEDSSKYQNLTKKKFNFKRFKIYQRRKQGINFILNTYPSYCISRPNYSRLEVQAKLAKKYDVPEFIINIAYDLKRGNPVDKFLTKKYEEWSQKGYLKYEQNLENIYAARGGALEGGKLNFDIRVMRNSILWIYGKIAILRGNTKECVSDYVRREYATRRPYENKNQFFTLPLAESDTIILGYHSELSPFAAELEAISAKYVYVESLTEEQRAFFVPEAK